MNAYRTERHGAGSGILKRPVQWAVCLMVLNGLAACATPPAAPTNLRICDAVNPVGTGADPFFGWLVNDPDPNEIQAGHRILVALSDAVLAEDRGDIWDSGWTKSRLQNHVAYAGKPLQSDIRYCWKVQTRDRNGNAGAWSEPGYFTVGLLSNADWAGASWVRRDTSDADDYTYYRKTAELPGKQIERATVYIAGVHKYALYLNGTLVGKGPAYQHPQYQYYNAFDVTDLVKADASNVFAVFNHWFGGGQGRPVSERGIIMKAVIHYTDGTLDTIGTDASWRQLKAPAWDSDGKHRNRGEGVGYVETIDARKLIPDWNTLAFDDSEWQPVDVVGEQPVAPWTGQLNPDLTRIEEYEITPASVTRGKGNRYLVDLGKVYAGMPRIRFSGGQPGDKVEMLGGYALDSSGRIDPDKNQSTDMHYYAVLNGKPFVYEPVEYLGMRYFEIMDPPMPVTPSNFTFIVRHSAMDTTVSSFDSPDETLNAVWELMKHSLLTCAQEEFVDTPTREKGGFLGDSAIQSSVAMPVMNERLLTRRVLNEFLKSMEQHWSDPDNLGRMNAVYPNRDGGRDIPDFTQAYPVWVWNYYMETGDRAFLENNYDRLKDIADYVDRYRDAETGLITNLKGGSSAYEFGIVDWPATMRYGYDMTAARTVINGWALADCRVLAEIAGVLGQTTDRKRYEERAEALQKAINAELLKKSGVYVDGLDAGGSRSSHVSQHANMFPLALGIVPDAQRASVAAEVKEQGMSVGMVTLPWLIRAIGEADEGEHLLKLFTHEEWPGWAQCLSRGATATWESWDADTENQSMSHAWGAGGLEGYVRYVLGIRPLKPQYEEVLIHPLDFGERLEWAHGTIPTDRGPVSVHWKHSGNRYGMLLELPANVTARVAVPKGRAAGAEVLVDGSAVQGIESGRYVIVGNIGSGSHTITRQLK